MSDITTARVDFKLVRTITEEFPTSSWHTFRGKDIHAATPRSPNAKVWSNLKTIRDVGGNYAFLFPKEHFKREREISLDGPNQRKIPFRFCSDSHPGTDEYFVAYVGKAARLTQRFFWHFSGAESNTGGQVQYGLYKSGMCETRPDAVAFMLRHAVIAYRTLPGDENAANRDLLELSLCARFAPPFNIKSER
jgi:hypothetical protein